MTPETENIGFVSTRFASTDGVTLESRKWARVLDMEEHRCFWYAGRLETSPDISHCIPEAFFGHPENLWINERIWGKTMRSLLVPNVLLDFENPPPPRTAMLPTFAPRSAWHRTPS